MDPIPKRAKKNNAPKGKTTSSKAKKVDPLQLVTASPVIVSGWMIKNQNPKERKFRHSNMSHLRRLTPRKPLPIEGDANKSTEVDVYQKPKRCGWIAPLRRVMNNKPLPPPTLRIWDQWAFHHWKFASFRNRIGVYADTEMLEEYFRPFHIKPVDYVKRNKSSFMEQVCQGRHNLELDIAYARRHQPPILEGNTTLAELKQNRDARRFFVRTTGCKSSAGLKNITDYALAFIVQYVRSDYKETNDLHTKTTQYALTG